MTGAASDLGDLARAWTRLGADDDTARRRIAALLGHDLPPLQAGSAPTPTPSAPSTAGPVGPTGVLPPETGPPPPATPGARPATLAVTALPPAPLPDWDPPPPLPHADPPFGAPPVPALLAPARERATLTALASHDLAEGELDVARAVAAIATRVPLPALPREAVRTLRLGADLLVDHRGALALFDADQVRLVDRLRALVGPHRLTVHRFEGDPTTPWTDDDPRPRRFLPRAGRPVVALTDLGTLDDAPDLAAWTALAAACARAGAPLVALVPRARAALPRRLPRGLRAVIWDRHTPVSQARRGVDR